MDSSYQLNERSLYDMRQKLTSLQNFVTASQLHQANENASRSKRARKRVRHSEKIANGTMSHSNSPHRLSASTDDMLYTVQAASESENVSRRPWFMQLVQFPASSRNRKAHVRSHTEANANVIALADPFLLMGVWDEEEVETEVDAGKLVDATIMHEYANHLRRFMVGDVPPSVAMSEAWKAARISMKTSLVVALVHLLDGNAWIGCGGDARCILTAASRPNVLFETRDPSPDPSTIQDAHQLAQLEIRQISPEMKSHMYRDMDPYLIHVKFPFSPYSRPLAWPFLYASMQTTFAPWPSAPHFPVVVDTLAANDVLYLVLGSSTVWNHPQPHLRPHPDMIAACVKSADGNSQAVISALEMYRREMTVNVTAATATTDATAEITETTTSTGTTTTSTKMGTNYRNRTLLVCRITCVPSIHQ